MARFSRKVKGVIMSSNPSKNIKKKKSAGKCPISPPSKAATVLSIIRSQKGFLKTHFLKSETKPQNYNNGQAKMGSSRRETHEEAEANTQRRRGARGEAWL